MAKEKLKRIITLVTRAQARRGTRFSIKIHSTCKKCPFLNACIGKLREGLTYEVVNVRKISHICPLTKAEMVVVEVIEVPKTIALPSKMAMEGVILTYKPIQCNYYTCPYYEYCFPKGFRSREKIIIERIISSVKCPKRINLKLVSVRRLAAFEKLF